MVQGGQSWLKLGDELSNPILVASSLRMTRKLFNSQIRGVQKEIFWSEMLRISVGSSCLLSSLLFKQRK